MSAVYSLFDPLGFIAPYIMKAKLLLQALSRKNIGWDDLFGEAERIQWRRWLDDLPKLQEVQVHCCFRPREFGEVREVKLHLFVDASRQGYAYLCEGREQSNVLCICSGKGKVSPNV